MVDHDWDVIVKWGRGNTAGCCDGHDDGMGPCVDDDGLGPCVVTC